MPELPEVETIVRELNQRLAGRRLGEVLHVRRDMVHGEPRPLGTLVAGRRVRGVRRRAKRVIMVLCDPARFRKNGEPRTQVRSVASNGKRRGAARIHAGPVTELIFHLGMSGRLTLAHPAEPIEPHTHLRLAIQGRPTLELRFRDPRRFGGIWCCAGGSRQVGKRLGPLGVEPLEVTPARFRRLLARKRGIKALLLDQAIIAGLGNIYADESLFAAGIHPLTSSAALSAEQANRLYRAIRSTLRKAIRFKGSTFMDYRRADGTAGAFQDHHRVYHRHGSPCSSCGTTVVRITAAGRSTFLCPKCQIMGTVNG